MCRNVITLCLGITLNCLESLYTQPGMLIYSRNRLVIQLKWLLYGVTSLRSCLSLWKLLIPLNIFVSHHCIYRLPRWLCVAAGGWGQETSSRAALGGGSPLPRIASPEPFQPSCSQTPSLRPSPCCHLLSWVLAHVHPGGSPGPCPLTRASPRLPTWAMSTTAPPWPSHHSWVTSGSLWNSTPCSWLWLPILSALFY